MAKNQAESSLPELSSLTKLINSASGTGNPLAATTIQTLHNLQHQHLWTSLQTHDISPQSHTTKATSTDSNTSSPSISTTDAVPTLISGIPPHRVYTHPDEQLYLLEQGLREDDLKPDRMFVIPTAQGQNWSLRRMAGVFDALSEITIAGDEAGSVGGEVDPDKAKKIEKYLERREKVRATKEWGGKRVLLSMVDKGMGGEGTVVYYVVQEGEVKPRQN